MTTLIEEHDHRLLLDQPRSDTSGNPDWPVMEIVIRRSPGVLPDTTRTIVLPIRPLPVDPDDDLTNATWEDAEWQ